MFAMPLMQVILFGFALTSEVKNADLLIIDQANDNLSQQMKNKFAAASHFIIHQKNISPAAIDAEFKKGIIKAAVIFPPGFSNDLGKTGSAQLQVITDGSEPNTAKTIVQYIHAMVTDMQQGNTLQSMPYRFEPQVRMMYNEEGNGSVNFVPGVMALVLMLICTALTSVAVVREKELGTMEILLVSPFQPLMVLVAKAIPYLLLSLLNFTLILLVTIFVMEVPVRGSILLLYFETLLFILASLSIGLVISNNTSSQQVALLISFMGMLLPTIIFTGFIFPLESMPKVFQVIALAIPARWYYFITKTVMIKGAGLETVIWETVVLLGMSVLFMGIAFRKFKTRLE